MQERNSLRDKVQDTFKNVNVTDKERVGKTEQASNSIRSDFMFHLFILTNLWFMIPIMNHKFDMIDYWNHEPQGTHHMVISHPGQHCYCHYQTMHEHM